MGVSPELLRAWERRYGLLRPVRSPGGFRLYGEEDAERVARMRVALDAGHSAAEAARVALGPVLPSAGSLRDQALERLLEAVRGYDESAVHTTIDEAMAAFGLEAVLEDLLLPVLVEVGSRWERGELTISQEHFASNLIRGRMLSLARLWGRGSGPLAVLACVAGEPHDIGLLAFGLVLRSYGWRILFLGGDTPTSTLSDTSRSIGPQAVVVSSFDRGRLESEAPGLRHLARSVPVVVAGPGATEALAKRIRARRLDGSVVSAARDLAGVEAG